MKLGPTSAFVQWQKQRPAQPQLLLVAFENSTMAEKESRGAASTKLSKHRLSATSVGAMQQKMDQGTNCVFSCQAVQSSAVHR